MCWNLETVEKNVVKSQRILDYNQVTSLILQSLNVRFVVAGILNSVLIRGDLG